MKLVEAIKMMEKQEKMQQLAENDMQKAVAVVKRALAVETKYTKNMEKELVPVKTYLLMEDIIALKEKTKEPTIIGAISKAVDYYLKRGENE